jgi:hypothetical protein
MRKRFAQIGPSPSALATFRKRSSAASKTLDDFCRDFVRGRQQIRVVERMILHPKDVEIDLVARQEGLQRKALELFSLVTG